VEESRLFAILGLGFTAAIAAVLTFYFHSPYIISLLILLGWSSLGQLVTLDDDLPGGWSNPDGDPSSARRAKIWLCSTVATFAAVFWLLYTFPHIQDYRW
jgi:hypothetical protein